MFVFFVFVVCAFVFNHSSFLFVFCCRCCDLFRCAFWGWCPSCVLCLDVLCCVCLLLFADFLRVLRVMPVAWYVLFVACFLDR